MVPVTPVRPDGKVPDAIKTAILESGAETADSCVVIVEMEKHAIDSTVPAVTDATPDIKTLTCAIKRVHLVCGVKDVLRNVGIVA